MFIIISILVVYLYVVLKTQHHHLVQLWTAKDLEDLEEPAPVNPPVRDAHESAGVMEDDDGYSPSVLDDSAGVNGDVKLKVEDEEIARPACAVNGGGGSALDSAVIDDALQPLRNVGSMENIISEPAAEPMAVDGAPPADIAPPIDGGVAPGADHLSDDLAGAADVAVPPPGGAGAADVAVPPPGGAGAADVAMPPPRPARAAAAGAADLAPPLPPPAEDPFPDDMPLQALIGARPDHGAAPAAARGPRAAAAYSLTWTDVRCRNCNQICGQLKFSPGPSRGDRKDPPTWFMRVKTFGGVWPMNGPDFRRRCTSVFGDTDTLTRDWIQDNRHCCRY